MKSVTLTDLHDVDQRSQSSLKKFAWRITNMPVIKGIDGGSFKIPLLDIETISLPLPKQNVTEAQVAATTLYFADKSQLDQFNMSIKLDSDASNLQYFIEWNKNIQNPYSGGFYLPTQYKRVVEAELYNGKGEIVLSAVLKGCWPSTIEELTLDASDDSHKLNVSFSIDSLVPKFHKKNAV